MGRRQKLFKNKFKYNNMMRSILKEKNQNERIKSLKSNLLIRNQSKSENFFPDQDNFNKYYETQNNIDKINNINIINNTYRKDLNNIISRINRPDERLIYCLKMLGMEKYYFHFYEKNITFEEFLALTNEDMTKMKIPKNSQKIIQRFTMDYLYFGNLYTLEEIKNFFRRNKYKSDSYNQIYPNLSKSYDVYLKREKLKNNNNDTVAKNLVINNYLSEQDKIIKRNNNFKNSNYNKYVSLSQGNYSFRSPNLNNKNMHDKFEKKRFVNNGQYIFNYRQKDYKNEINNNKNYNIKNNKLSNYNIDFFDINHLSYNDKNMNIFHSQNEINNYINKNEKIYEIYNTPRASNKYLENNKIKNNNFRHQSANPTKNIMNEYNILNLKNSYENLYTQNLNKDYQNINNNNPNPIYNNFINDDSTTNNNYFKKNKNQKLSNSRTRNKTLNNIDDIPLMSEGNSGMIMNNLNNYFIYNNYRNEDNFDGLKGKTKINKNHINKLINKPIINNIKNKKFRDNLNKYINRNIYNLNINKKINQSNEINSNIQILNKNIINNTMFDYNTKTNNFLKIPMNNIQLNNNQVNNGFVNNFRTRKNKNIPSYKYIKNLNKINVDNNMKNISRNVYNNLLITEMNYTDNNDINKYNISKLNKNNKGEKEIILNYINKLPTKRKNNNMPDKNNNCLQINSNNNKIYKNKRQQYHNNYSRNNQNEIFFKSNFNTNPNLQKNLNKKGNNGSKFELLKKEINELYNKMQMYNIIDDNDINLNNLTYQKEFMKNNFSKSTNNFFDENNIENNKYT